MTTNRARAYGRVMSLIEELGPAKLHTDEQQTVRDAADALLFCADIASDQDAKDALDRLDDVMQTLVDGERFLPETADGLLEAVEACGPHTEPLSLPQAA